MTNSSFGRTLVIGLVTLGLAGMFAWSMAYRAQNPSLTVPLQRQASMEQGAQGMPAAMQGGEAMNTIMAAMNALKQNPDDLHAMVDAIEALMAGELWDKAASLLEKASAKAPDDPIVLNYSGVVLVRMEKPAEAVQKFERMLELDANNYRAQYNLAVALKHGLSDPAKAAVYYQKVLDNPNTDPEIRQQAKEELAPGQ